MSEIAESKGSKYSDDQRLEVVATYLALGSDTATSEALNIPRRTIHQWRHSEWWQPICDNLRQQHKDKTLAHLSSIIDRAYTEVADRIDNGDDIVHQGEVTGRKRMTGKDLAVVAAISVDKRQILLNQPTSIRGESSGMTDLVKRFEELAAASQARVVSDQ